MRAAIRLLLALTLLGWGQLASASTIHYWKVAISGGSYTAPEYASDTAACAAQNPPPPGGWQWTNTIERVSDTVSRCVRTYGPSSQCPTCQPVIGEVHRLTRTCEWGNTGLQCNASCDDPNVMENGQCVAPKDCSAHDGKFVVAAVDAQKAGDLYATPNQVSIDGALYNSAPDGQTRCKPNFDGSGTAICAARYHSSGECAPTGSADLADGTFVDVTDGSTGGQKCLNFGGGQLCLSPDNAGCDVYQGNPWCYQTGDNCGEVKLSGDTSSTFVCFPKTSRQCTYVNGKMECIETGNPQGSTPPNYIPDTSSDHPYNGGNADGNDTNDPKAPGTAGGSAGGGGGGAQGSDSAATNESIRELGEKVDESNSLLDDIRDLLTGDGDESGNSEGSPADAEAEGAAVGNAVGESITTHMQTIDEERNEEVQTVLDELPSQVGQWINADGSSVGLDFIDNILPQPVACTDYVVPFSLDRYTANIRLPVCALAPYKPILEWVIWCLTAIGAWRIGYAALRQQDNQAAKGGY